VFAGVFRVNWDIVLGFLDWETEGVEISEKGRRDRKKGGVSQRLKILLYRMSHTISIMLVYAVEFSPRLLSLEQLCGK